MKLLKVVSINALCFLIFFIGIDSCILLSSPGKRGPRKISAYYHHGLLPGREFVHEWVPGQTIREKTNKFGFRRTSSDQGVNLLAEYRTVVVGDSFAEGVGIPYYDTFASLLPQEFMPVANIGVVSYSPYLYRRKLRYLKERGLNPESIIQIVDPSDIHDDFHYRSEGFRSLPMPDLLENSWFSKTYSYRFLLQLFWALNAQGPLHRFSPRRNQWLESYAEVRNPYQLEYSPWFYKEGKELLIDEVLGVIDMFPRSRHYIIAYDWGPRGMTNSGKKLYIKYIEDLASALSTRRSVSFCDMTGVVSLSDGYIEGDFHWNSAGNLTVRNEFISNCAVRAPSR